MNTKTRILLRAAAIWVAVVAFLVGVRMAAHYECLLQVLRTTAAIAFFLALACVAYGMSEVMEEKRTQEKK
jgi:hypothetical protein